MPSAARITLLAMLLGACSSEIGAGPDGGANGGADASPADAALPIPAPPRYPADRLRSPITAVVAERLVEIADRSDSTNPLVFMKVGASGTVTSKFLDCFAGSGVDLDGRDHLQPTIDHYRAPEAAGASSWARDTLAAKSGRSAGWVISDTPSPLEQEIAAINPQVALVNYGTNDMGLGITYETALWPFVSNFTRLLDQLESAGIIPIITGLNPRSDSADAARWVPTYNAVTRAIAEARQIPYINLYLASVDLPDMGLLSDGIHGNAYAEPCDFTAEALQYNYNVRNLLTLESLDAVRAVVQGGSGAIDPETARHAGSGAPSDPFVVDALPFTHHGDTAASPHQHIDGYPACDSGQDESGPELVYRLEIEQTTPVRILAIDGEGVDVDVHLLAGSADASACIERAHRIIERTLDPGTYYISVDSFVSGGQPLAGRYSLVVLACEPGDSRCQ